MDPNDCTKLVDYYLNFLRDNTEARCDTGGSACEITTPFLDRHNDHIQVYVLPRGGGFALSDDGHTLSELRTAGVDLNTTKRIQTIQVILNGFGVQKKGVQLVSDATADNFGQRLHFFVQAMLAMGDMHVLAQPKVASYFKEDVGKFLSEARVRYSANVKLEGKSGYDHAIDFLIPKSETRPERFVQTMSDLSKNAIGSHLFTLSDTRDARGPDSEAYVLINNKLKVDIPQHVQDAFDHYKVKSIAWSDREKFTAALAS